MDNLKYIDDYFNSLPTAEQKQQFEQRVVQDSSFAEEVAFYISANGVIEEQVREQKKQRFREIYQEQKVIPIMRRPVKKIWRYTAAASVVAIVMLTTWFLSGGKTSPSQLADQYIQQNFKTLGVTMGNPDSLQMGLNLFNEGKLAAALGWFQQIIQKDTTNYTAKKYAGIVSLRLGDYDKALEYFTLLKRDTVLYSNPGKFYHAVALLKRNKSGDVAEAKKILKEVVEKEMEGKEEAANWLKKLE